MGYAPTESAQTIIHMKIAVVVTHQVIVLILLKV